MLKALLTFAILTIGCMCFPDYNETYVAENFRSIPNNPDKLFPDFDILPIKWEFDFEIIRENKKGIAFHTLLAPYEGHFASTVGILQLVSVVFQFPLKNVCVLILNFDSLSTKNKYTVKSTVFRTPTTESLKRQAAGNAVYANTAVAQAVTNRLQAEEDRYEKNASFSIKWIVPLLKDQKPRFTHFLEGNRRMKSYAALPVFVDDKVLKALNKVRKTMVIQDDIKEPKHPASSSRLQ